jgi:hypothetical protein
MPLDLSIISPLLCVGMSIATAAAITPQSAGTASGVAIPKRAAASAPSDFYLPGRRDDARVAVITYRLATLGHARCPAPVAETGLVLQHLSQFDIADRAGILSTWPIDRGPGVIVVVPTSPAATAGFRAGDIMLAIDGMAIPPENDLVLPFEAAGARLRADAVLDLLQTAQSVTLLRDGTPHVARLKPILACPSRVHLARSKQRNAFADGRHIFLTTGVLAQLRNDDEVAFLIAHEMAHNILGHAAMMRSGEIRGRQGVRQIESAADRLGGTLMLDAGFDPVKGAALLKRLDGSDFGISLFANHEPAAKRIASLQAFVAEHRAP